MGEVSTIGLDIAKSVFQVHGVDAMGSVVIRKRVSRAKVLEYFGELPRCLVGIEACPSAHGAASFKRQAVRGHRAWSSLIRLAGYQAIFQRRHQYRPDTSTRVGISRL